MIGRPTSRTCSTGGRAPRPTGWRPRWTPRLHGLRRGPGRPGAVRADRRPVQLVRPAVPAPVLGRRPGGAADPARLPGRPDPAAGAVRPVRHRAGLAGAVRREHRRSARYTWPAGRPPTRRGTSSCPSRWRWSAGWSSWDGRPGPAPGSRPGSRWPARWSRHPGWDRLPDALRQQVADELNVATLAELASAEDLVNVTVKPNFRALGKRFGNRTKDVAAAISAPRPGGAGRRAAGRWLGATWISSARTCVRRGRDHQRGTGVRLGGGDRRGGHGGAGPGADPAAAPARRAARRGADRAGGPQVGRVRRSPTGSACTGGSAAHRSRPRRSASTPPSCRARCWPPPSPRASRPIGRATTRSATTELGLHLWLAAPTERADRRTSGPCRSGRRDPVVRIAAARTGVKPSSTAWLSGIGSPARPVRKSQPARW